MTFQEIKAKKGSVNYRIGMRRWGETYCQDCVHVRENNTGEGKRQTYFCQCLCCAVGATKTCDNARPRKEEASND